MSWPVGVGRVVELIAVRELERVQPNREGAAALLASAARHLASAALVAEDDPEGG